MEFNHLPADFRIFSGILKEPHLLEQAPYSSLSLASWATNGNLFSVSIDVRSDCCNKMPQAAWFISNRNQFLVILEAWKWHQLT